MRSSAKYVAPDASKDRLTSRDGRSVCGRVTTCSCITVSHSGNRATSSVLVIGVALFAASAGNIRCSFGRRYGSWYVFYDDEEDAASVGMLEGDQNRAPNLYEIELVVPTSPVHRADLHLWELAWLYIHDPLEAEGLARAYWSSDMPTGRAELLTLSDLRIVSVIERSRPRH